MPAVKPVLDLTLPGDVVAEMTAVAPEVKKAQHAVSVLKGLGVDVSDMESKLAWAEKVRTTLLKEFG